MDRQRTGGPRPLAELARLYGIQLSYTDLSRRKRRARTETLLAVLSALGCRVESAHDAREALRSARLERARRMVEPVAVAWDGRFAGNGFPVRIPGAAPEQELRVLLALEGEDERDVSRAWRRVPSSVVGEIDGVRLAGMHLVPPSPLPDGYHRLRLETRGGSAVSMVISAPRRADDRRGPSWGLFLPLYALRSARSWGVGDLTDLGSLMEWACGLGSGVIATLPLLAAFLGDRPFEPSPYAPVSRLFWNELFLDVERVPEAQASVEARRVVSSQRLRRELEWLRGQPLVDYRRAMAAKRRVLEAMCRHVFSGQGGRRASELRAWAGRNPRAADYAAFRAATERHGLPWSDWPGRERDGLLPALGGDRDAYRYHLYVQWMMSEQVDEMGRLARRVGSDIYFDLPIGVHPDGYDVWRERDAFLMGVSAGSPPDPFFTGGQDWGFPPLHPERIREQGYAYPIACLRHHLRHAQVLRIDHVMGLHRLYVVPGGFGARDGAYVRYRPEEFYAILALEARRSGAVIVGEDLGTVPDEVRRDMAAHHVYRSFVAEYEATPDPNDALPTPPAESLAAVQTHDMPLFAAWWRGLDIPMRVALGWMTEDEARRELAERDRVRTAIVRFLVQRGWLSPERAASDRAGRDGTAAVLRGLLSSLSASPARILTVNLEDLWGETAPQNVPGTIEEYPNWRRKARFGLEEIPELRRVTGALTRIDRLRTASPGRLRVGARVLGTLGE